MVITYLQTPREQKMHSLWYGGRVAELEHRGYKFILGAFGDVIGTLVDSEDGHEFCYFKDKQNGGYFEDIVSGYLDNDNDLSQAMQGKNGIDLELSSNNWWEILIDGPDGNQYDFGWICNSDYYEDALREMVDNADQVIDELEPPVHSYAG